jgi:hypothetical protein
VDNEDQTEAELDALLEARNTQIREQWVNDPSFRAAQKSKYLKLLTLRRSQQRSNFGGWIRCWRLLNSDVESDVIQGRLEAKRKMDMLCVANKRERNWVTSQTSEPEDAPKKEEVVAEESYGAAGEF